MFPELLQWLWHSVVCCESIRHRSIQTVREKVRIQPLRTSYVSCLIVHLLNVKIQYVCWVAQCLSSILFTLWPDWQLKTTLGRSVNETPIIWHFATVIEMCIWNGAFNVPQHSSWTVSKSRSKMMEIYFMKFSFISCYWKLKPFPFNLSYTLRTSNADGV